MTDKDTTLKKDVIVLENGDKGDKSQVPKDPYFKVEFEKFLELIGRKSVGHWVQIANALGVSVNTITRWKSHPLAQKLIRDEIEKSLEGMEEAGAKDWKMWESRLKMLGVSPIEKSEVDHRSLGERIEGFNYLPPAKENDSNDTSVSKTA